MRHYRPLLLTVATATIAILTACGGGSSTPSSPTSAGFSLTGFVYDRVRDTSARIAGARVEIVGGPGTGKVSTTDSTGTYRFEQLASGTVSLRVTANEFQALTRDVPIASNIEISLAILPVRVSVAGNVTQALTSQPLAGVTVNGGEETTTTDAAGNFVVARPPDLTTPAPFMFTGPLTVERQAALRLPGRDAQVSLIPTSFDLAAFDEGFRTPLLRRWVVAPALVLERRTAQFVESDASSVTLIDDVMSDADAAKVIADLQSALRDLTGGAFNDFASVTQQTSAVGSSLTLLTQGRITYVRAKGLLQVTRTAIGFGQWLYFPAEGRVVGGMAMLDLDWERSGHRYVTTVRQHELGHALGIQHITKRVSVMAPVDNVDEIPPSDRDAGRIAFQRPPGNRSPDIDPTGFPSNTLSLVPVPGPRIR